MEYAAIGVPDSPNSLPNRQRDKFTLYYPVLNAMPTPKCEMRILSRFAHDCPLLVELALEGALDGLVG